VPAGSLTAVLGPSGCGKTTLLRLIGGFEHADGGSIRLGQRLLCEPGTHLAPERREIGFVPQEGALFPHLDVAANVGFGLPRAERRGDRVEELLELVDLDGLGGRFPHQLSGGQQQRVALARALAPEPGLILLDEPFDALDAGLRAQVRGEVREALRAAGATALLVTHDQEEALSLADTVAVMRGGRIVQVGDPQTLYRDPVDADVAVFVGEAVLLDAKVLNGQAETALGRLPVRGDAQRRTLVMLRPEQISCHDRLLDGAPGGRVVATQFFGHDASARIALSARCAGHRVPAVGDEVSIVVEGTALALAGSGAPSPLLAAGVRRIPPTAAPPANLLGVSGGPPRA
jgi:iron(III) transport system ATP-binding protein